MTTLARSYAPIGVDDIPEAIPNLHPRAFVCALVVSLGLWWVILSRFLG